MVLVEMEAARRLMASTLVQAATAVMDTSESQCGTEHGRNGDITGDR
jgi:hypothetical protein